MRERLPDIEALARVRGCYLEDHVMARIRRSSPLPARLGPRVGRPLRGAPGFADRRIAAGTSGSETGGRRRRNVPRRSCRDRAWAGLYVGPQASRIVELQPAPAAVKQAAAAGETFQKVQEPAMHAVDLVGLFEAYYPVRATQRRSEEH